LRIDNNDVFIKISLPGPNEDIRQENQITNLRLTKDENLHELVFVHASGGEMFMSGSSVQSTLRLTNVGWVDDAY
jgi:hypothetical protein